MGQSSSPVARNAHIPPFRTRSAPPRIEPMREQHGKGQASKFTTAVATTILAAKFECTLLATRRPFWPAPRPSSTKPARMTHHGRPYWAPSAAVHQARGQQPARRTGARSRGGMRNGENFRWAVKYSPLPQLSACRCPLAFALTSPVSIAEISPALSCRPTPVSVHLVALPIQHHRHTHIAPPPLPSPRPPPIPTALLRRYSPPQGLLLSSIPILV